MIPLDSAYGLARGKVRDFRLILRDTPSDIAEYPWILALGLYRDFI